MSKEYNIGIYIRLSMADEDTGYGSKAESDSIGNQIGRASCRERV